VSLPERVPVVFAMCSPVPELVDVRSVNSTPWRLLSVPRRGTMFVTAEA
jgi:hypothetical protein